MGPLLVGGSAVGRPGEDVILDVSENSVHNFAPHDSDSDRLHHFNTIAILYKIQDKVENSLFILKI